MGVKRTPPWPTYPEWTTSKYFSFLRSAIRGGAKRWPPKQEILRDSKHRVPVLDEDGNKQYYKTGAKAGQVKTRFECKCAECEGSFPVAQVEVDHIIPAGSVTSYEDLIPFIERLFVPKDMLQVLCKGCHRKKTNEERRKKK